MPLAMELKQGPVNVTQELAALKYERKNDQMKKLPANYSIQRRPLNHAPIASPYAGASVPKVVFVRTNTPLMSAVKKVKKHLQHIEKRAMQGIDIRGQNHQKTMKALAEASERLVKRPEEVTVKASGRARTQALRIGEWFRTREKEMLCNVVVQNGSVAAVDDIMECDQNDTDDEDVEETSTDRTGVNETTLEGGDTTMELLGSQKTTAMDQSAIEAGTVVPIQRPVEPQEDTKRSLVRRRKRMRKTYDKDNIPEARIRWIKTVEVVISLKG